MAAERRGDPATVEGRLWGGLRRLVDARRATRAVHAQGLSEPVWTGNDHVFGLLREHAGERLLVLANFTAEPQPVRAAVAAERAVGPAEPEPAPDGRPLRADGDFLVLAPYQHTWLRG